MRVLVALAAGLAGCSFSAPDGGGEFACSAAAPECPGGTMCIDGRCRVPADAASPPSGFRFRQKLTFNNLKHGTVAEFPVLVRLDAGVFDYSEAADDGSDLRFFDPDETPLPYEVDTWREGGRSLLWVKVPEVTGSSDLDYVWLYYGNPTPPAPTDGDVWSAYQAVFHMGESVADSAALGIEATPSGTEVVSGRVGLGRQFNGTSDHIVLGPEPPLLRGVPGMTLEAWVSYNTLPVDRDEVVLAVSAHGADFSRAQIKIDSAGSIRAVFRTQDIEGVNAVYTLDSPLAAGEWTWVVATMDLAQGELRITLDGDQVSEVMTDALDEVTTDTFPDQALVSIDETGGEWFLGVLDELRITGRAMSQDWVALQYASMTDDLVGFEGPEAL